MLVLTIYGTVHVHVCVQRNYSDVMILKLPYPFGKL